MVSDLSVVIFISAIFILLVFFIWSKKAQKDNQMTEDDQKQLEDKIKKLTDEKIKEIDGILSEKDKEILSV